MSAHITTHFRRFRLLELLLSAVPLCAAGTNAVAAPVYTFTDLGPPGGTVSYGSGINNSGKVIGSIYVAGDQHATLWNGTTATDLGTLGGTSSFGVGINDSGQVVGWSYTTAVGEGYHATLWNGTAVTDLGTLGGTYSLAYGINNSGQVVGFGHTAGDAAAHATLWNGTAVTDLGTLGGTSSYAFGISDSGQVVGRAYTAAGDQHATLWNGTTATDLGTLGGKISYAFGINNSGQVVGSSFIPGNVVTHATLWNGAAGTDLNSFLDAATVSSGWVLTEGHGINDSGWITGVARNSITGQEHAYLLSAVPEPETCALMLAGLGVLGLTVRYRKRATA
ncbi:PEP-CTERM sorting domain-containing protein [Accumulibacter sp.]|uniref:PEP-CTERM sorting domain-containing protein n=1 Tax=Accumulibacter sp. TaxID=2053492 RepID=UPI001A364250|nr:PEP-CTERM sorting domain-containing protein [Accumulibacter sp.]MBL8402492.1 PEP-CTERM sorting domain-containing protein [Accumulibacter sp.]